MHGDESGEPKLGYTGGTREVVVVHGFSYNCPMSSHDWKDDDQGTEGTAEPIAALHFDDSEGVLMAEDSNGERHIIATNKNEASQIIEFLRKQFKIM